MRKIKILYAIDDSIEEIKNYILTGNEYPKTYFWWDYMDDNSKYELYFINNNKPRKGFLKFIEKITGFRNIPYQIDVIRKQNEYDVIFCSLDYFFFIVIFLRYLKIIKRPIFAYSHGSLNYKISSEKWYYRLRFRLYYYFVVRGIDYLSFMTENALKNAKEVHKITDKNNHIINMSVDFDFYNNYKAQTDENNLFFLTSGSSNRDFKLLLQVFKVLPYQLKIFQKLDDLGISISEVPNNITFREHKSDGDLGGFKTIRKRYKESFAVLIALEKQFDGPHGITVLLEAMACGKPVIVTDNILFPFDVEEEGVGIKVAFGDKDGWIKAINYLVNNKDIAKKMGEKGYELIKTKHNYDFYKNELLQNFDVFIAQNNISPKI